MPIDLDARAAIRHPDLGRVVQAVVEADAHDDADWIEWKSDLDLSTKKGCFPIARTILGMANRMPAAAALVCEGLGYIVVGAEPGNLLGVVSVDPADLDQILEPWLGGVEGPRYMPTYVLTEGKKVSSWSSRRRGTATRSTPCARSSRAAATVTSSSASRAGPSVPTPQT